MIARLIAAVLLLAGFALSASAATVPVGFNDRQIATGFTSPTALTALPDGRVLAMQQNGIIRIIKGDVLLAANFWGVPNVDSTNERGCLGIVPDPQFATNHYVYVYCSIISGTTSNNRIIRVTEANAPRWNTTPTSRSARPTVEESVMEPSTTSTLVP